MKQVLLRRRSKDAIIPTYETKGAHGVDIAAIEECVIPAMGRVIVHTGIEMELPEGMAALILSRSGYAAKHGVYVLNAPGLIDSDYRGEIKIILANSTTEDFVIRRGSRVAQMIFTEPLRPWLSLTANELSQTDRGEGGFGSTGF